MPAPSPPPAGPAPGTPAHSAAAAAEVRRRLAAHGVLAVDFIGPEAAGKTTLIAQTLGILGRAYRSTVIQPAPPDRLEAQQLQRVGARLVTVPLRNATHLDAASVLEALESISLDAVDLLFIERANGLEEPPLWDVGAGHTVIVFPVTEVPDLADRYPQAFRRADCLLVSKLDLLPARAFDLEGALRRARNVHPDLELFLTSTETGDGIDEWYRWVETCTRPGGS